MALLQGCGARTIADEYRDGGVADAPPGDTSPDTSPDAQPDVQPTCPPGQVRCGGRCVDLFSDAMNCGACGRACPAGRRCAMGACETVTMTGGPFQILSLTANNCVTVEHAMVTGDDRGGIVLGPRQVFYTGDTRTAGFDLDRLNPVTTFTQPLDGLLGDLRVPVPATLASNRVPLDTRTSIVDALLSVNDDSTLGPAPNPLSSVIFLDRAALSSSAVGIFSGAGRAVIVAGPRAWILDATRVTQLAVPPLGPHQGCESWAAWGVAEFIDGAVWVAYVRDGTTIVRQNLVTGEVRPIATFENLSDMCSFTVDPRRNRWYFHHEGASQFRTGDETLGYCDARIEN